MNENVSLVAPWIQYYNEMCAMFENDEEVTVKLGRNTDDDYTIKLFVDNNNKADALFRILAKEKKFGERNNFHKSNS